MRGMVAARKLKSVLRIADGAGVRPAAILARVGLTEDDLADDERLLSQDKWRDVWHVAVELLDNEAIGLQAGQRVDRGYFGVIDYLVRCSPSVGEALDVAVRFFRLANSHGRLEVIHRDGLVAVERHVLGDEAGALPPQAAEFALASMVQLFRDAAAPAWRLTRATFRHPEPRDSEQHRRFFTCPVEFSARADAIVIDEAVLSVGMRAPDPELRRLVASHGETLLRALPESGTIVEEVRRVLLRELPGARNGSDQVAGLLGTNRRTLHRHLREAGTSFRRVRDELRRDLAHRYLTDSEISIAEIALLLGYSEASAFNRAFKSWHAEGPAQFRRRAHAARHELSTR